MFTTVTDFASLIRQRAAGRPKDLETVAELERIQEERSSGYFQVDEDNLQ